MPLWVSRRSSPHLNTNPAHQSRGRLLCSNPCGMEEGINAGGEAFVSQAARGAALPLHPFSLSTSQPQSVFGMGECLEEGLVEGRVRGGFRKLGRVPLVSSLAWLPPLQFLCLSAFPLFLLPRHVSPDALAPLPSTHHMPACTTLPPLPAARAFLPRAPSSSLSTLPRGCRKHEEQSGNPVLQVPLHTWAALLGLSLQPRQGRWQVVGMAEGQQHTFSCREAGWMNSDAPSHHPSK